MVVGIDGVPYELLDRFAQNGVMPNCQRLIEKYSFKKTQAPLPEVSSVSWTSFMTGLNPGGHGVYGFMELHPNNYAYTFPSFRNLNVQPLWEVIAGNGKRSVIINLPSTYPVRPMSGVLVSGFVALDLEKAVFPPTLLPDLEAMNYQVDIDTDTPKTEPKLFLKELNDVLEIRFSLYKKLQSQEDWDLFFFIITGTDRLHHFLMDAAENPESPFHKEFIDYYRHVDTIIGDICGDMEKRGIPFIILSDHGFVPIKKEIYISQYLNTWGLLELEDRHPKNLKSMTGNTRVFALDPSRVYIHLEGKYRRGCVKKESAFALREEVKEKFLDMEIDGEPVIKRVFFKEELYNGGYFDQAPDLVLLSHHGFDIKSGVMKDSLYGNSIFTGMHSQDNALLIDSYGLELSEHPFIYEIGAELRGVLGDSK